MTSRERVLAAFAHEEPDRVPVWCGSSAEFWGNAKRVLQLDDEGLRVRVGDDFRRVTSRYAGPACSLSAGATGRTIFGVEHHVLIKSAVAQVRQKTREVVRRMMPGGGYVAGASHDSILEETPLENVLAMFDTVRECGRYR